MDFQEDTAIVKKIENNKVTVEIQRTGACEHCAIKGICGAGNKNIQHQIQTDLNLKIGDLVKIHISASSKIFSSFILFIFPILVMIIFYIFGKYLFRFNEDFSIIFSIFGLLFSGIFIYYIDKKYEKRINLKIIERIEK